MLKFDFNFIWTIFNLVLFFILMKVFLFKPIKKVLDKRKELIDKQFKDADEAQKQADELKVQYQNELDGVDEEKKQILVDARANAKKEYDKIIDLAQNDAEKLKANAKMASDLECEKAKLAVKEQIATLAMETAEKVVGKSVSPEVDSDIYNKFLSEGSDK